MPATIDLTKDTGAPDAEEQPIAEKGNCGSSGREENGVGQSAKGKEKEIEEGGESGREKEGRGGRERRKRKGGNEETYFCQEDTTASSHRPVKII